MHPSLYLLSIPKTKVTKVLISTSSEGSRLEDQDVTQRAEDAVSGGLSVPEERLDPPQPTATDTNTDSLV